jgi:excisionase family DNA binding protein
MDTTQNHTNPLDRPTMSVMEAAGLLGVSREAAYDGVRRGDIPSIRVGRAIRVPTAKLAAMLGIDQ